MPTLDDTPTIPQLAATAGNDSLLVSEKGGSGSSLVKRVPAGMITHGFTHAWRIDYTNDAFKLAATTCTVTLKAITNPSLIVKAQSFLVTPFAGSGVSSATVAIGNDNPDIYTEEQSIISGTDVAGTSNINGGDELQGETAELSGHLNSATKDLIATFVFNTNAATGSPLATVLTAGEILILVGIMEPTEYEGLVDLTTSNDLT